MKLITWNVEDIKRLNELVDRGLDVARIAHIMDTTVYNINVQLSKLKLAEKQDTQFKLVEAIRAALKTNKTLAQIASDLEVSLDFVQKKATLIRWEDTVVKKPTIVAAEKIKVFKKGSWSKEEEELLVQMKREGVDSDEISKTLNRNKGTISVKYAELRKKLPPSDLPKKLIGGLKKRIVFVTPSLPTDKLITVVSESSLRPAKGRKASEATVKKQTRMKRNWTVDEDKKLLKMVADKVDPLEISAVLDRTVYALNTRLSRLGYTLSRKHVEGVEYVDPNPVKEKLVLRPFVGSTTAEERDQIESNIAATTMLMDGDDPSKPEEKLVYADNLSIDEKLAIIRLALESKRTFIVAF